MSKGNGQGTAFLLWCAGGIWLTFLLRHPAGQQLLAGPRAGLYLALPLALLWAGWALGWPDRARWLGLLAAAALIALGAVFPWGAAVSLVLAGVLPLVFYLAPLRLGRTLPAIPLPALRLPRLSFHLALPAVQLPRRTAAPPVVAGPNVAPGPAPVPEWGGPAWRPRRPEGTPDAPAPASPAPCVEDDLAESAPAAVLPPERPVRFEAPSAPAERPVRVEAPSAPRAEEEEVGPVAEEALALTPRPPAADRDPAVALAAKVLAILHEKSLNPAFLHLLSEGQGSTALDLGLSSPRRQGEAISGLAPLFAQELGAVPGASLRGETLRLTFPAYAHGEPVYGEKSLWVPLGRTAKGQRMLANLLGLSTLLLLGEDPTPLVAATHTLVGAALAGTLSRRPSLLLAEESGQHLSAYRGLDGVTLYTGTEAVVQLNQYVLYQRSYPKITNPPILAVVLLPSAGALLQVHTLLQAGPAAGVYPVLVTDSPELDPVKALAAQVRARLVFQLKEEDSRFYLSQTGAERLADYQAIYHLTETMWEPEVLMTYSAEEEDVQRLLRGLEEEAFADDGGMGAAVAVADAEPLPEEMVAILEAVLEVGRYSVRQVYERVQDRGVTRQVVLDTEGFFEDAGVVERPENPLGRRTVRVQDRAEGMARLQAYLEGQR